MMIATNTGAGGTQGMPDVCLTPAPPAPPVPVPYPNMGLTLQAVPFVPTVFFTQKNALNMSSKLVTSMGMEAGVSHPMYKQYVSFTMGNPTVFCMGMPTIQQTSLTSGNGMNNGVGQVAIPSVTTVFLSQRPTTLDDSADPYGGAIDARALRAADVTVEVSDGTARLSLAVLGIDAASRVHGALRQIDDLERVVLDLRGCPGGSLEAALAIASAFVPRGTVLATVIDGDGDATLRRSRMPQTFDVPLAIWVDGATASAAELLAGALQCAGRAEVLGERTYGKSAVLVTGAGRPNGAVACHTVGRVLLPDGRDIEGVGLEPDGPLA